MVFIICFYIFVLGLVLGSFVNALEYRVDEKISVRGRSFCPKCKHQLSWYDLFPVFSWLLLKGRCRYCEEPISAQYPIVEILSGLSLATMAYAFGIIEQFQFALGGQLQDIYYSITSLFLVAIVSTILVLVALHDYKTGYVLSSYVYVAAFAALLLVSFTGNGYVGWSVLSNHIYASLGTALPFAVIWAFSRGKWMGAGDIELALLIGLLLGWPATLVSMYFAFIVGSVVGLMLVANKRTKLKSEIAFGPFLIAGVYFALLFSQQIADGYVRIFLG